jgi:hypothetical protein
MAIARGFAARPAKTRPFVALKQSKQNMFAAARLQNQIEMPP